MNLSLIKHDSGGPIDDVPSKADVSTSTLNKNREFSNDINIGDAIKAKDDGTECLLDEYIVVRASEKRLTPSSKDANAKKRKKRGVVVVWCASTSSSPVVESSLHTYTYR